MNSVGQITAAAQKGMSEFVLLTPVKARPVLVLTDVLEPYDEVLALGLHRLEQMGPDERQRTRDHDDPSLFHLAPDSFPGLPVENAAIVTALLRLPVTALDTSSELGTLNENELRVVHERLVKAHGLNLEMLVLQRASDLLDRLKRN